MLKWSDIIRFVNHGNPDPPRKVVKTAEQWKAILSAESYFVTRERGTERAHSSELCSLFDPGRYHCACCDIPLFDAQEKFHSRSGWPSFTQPIAVENVAYGKDTSHGMIRVEALCNVCDAHLGHVFPDGPSPGGLRYCINAVALKKETAGTEQVNT